MTGSASSTAIVIATFPPADTTSQALGGMWRNSGGIWKEKGLGIVFGWPGYLFGRVGIETSGKKPAQKGSGGCGGEGNEGGEKKVDG